jgi:hypothetical protein
MSFKQHVIALLLGIVLAIGLFALATFPFWGAMKGVK